jgi:uncharacterized damage-inducible protein DinB
MTTDQASAVLHLMTKTIEAESATTRKVIAAVPNGNRDYKPDPKSRSAWDIAVHIALSDIWFADSILKGEFAWTGEPPTPPEMSDPAGVAKWHERELSARLARLRAMPQEQLLKPVDFFGRSAPAVTWIVAMNNHHIHHRGQLASYLRAAGSKVPAIYGMSADENSFA